MSDTFDHWADALNGDGEPIPVRRSRPVQASLYGPPLKCNRCGAVGLYWQVVKGKHRVYEHATLKPHNCNRVADPSEFDVVDPAP